MIKIVGTNFKYHLEYDYDTNRYCSEHGCDDEGICRCSSIENAKVIDIRIPSVVNEIYANYFDNTLSTKRNSTINTILGGVTKEIDIYTIDRILRINKIWNPEFWNINVGGGYYGQEINEIFLTEDIVQILNTQLDKAFDIDNLTERIEYLLELENGFILDDIKGKEYKVLIIDIDDIIFSNNEHHKRVIIEELEHYSDKNYTGIRGIVQKDGVKWKVIDGYHRLSKTENKLVKVLVIN